MWHWILFVQNKFTHSSIFNPFLVNKNDSQIINRVEVSWEGLIIRNLNNERVFYADNYGNFIGANPNWGSTAFGTDWNSGSPRYYWGMDCSGYVSWAIRTACKPQINYLAGDFSVYSGKFISLADAKPGDLLDNDEHVQLIVKNNGDGSVIVTEETGGSISGLIFDYVDDASGYNVVDMSNWYSSNCQSSR